MTKTEKEEEKEWENVIYGLERANIKLYKYSLLVLFPKGFWKYYTYIGFVLFEILSIYYLIVGAISIYKQLHDIFSLFEMGHAYLILLGISINLNDFHIFRTSRTMWYKLLIYCKDDFYEYSCDSMKKESERLRSISKSNMELFFNICVPGIIINMIMVLVVIPLVRFFLEEEQKTSDPGFNIFLPLPVWSPYDSRTITGYAVSYALLVYFIALLLTIFLVYIATIFFFYMEVIIQLRILCFAIDKLDERVQAHWESQPSTKNNQHSQLIVIGNSYENSFYECSKEKIIHHLKIIEFFGLFQASSSFFFTLVLGFNILVIVAISMILTRIPSLLSIDGFKFCLILTFEVLHIFIYTYSGSMLIEETLKVQKCLYSCPWYDFSHEQKKILHIFQTQSGTRMLLKAAGLYEIQLDTFIQVMQTAYSVFNVFNTLNS